MTGYGDGEGARDVENCFLSSGFVFLNKIRHMGQEKVSRGRLSLTLDKLH